ncbi:MAG: winged helix-turn-helix transcriptional regulator [Phycisphaeraceae bacterium]|nr:winged helix-turn-helix transcriptional regulator [Phycisphaeraceae bacterium]
MVTRRPKRRPRPAKPRPAAATVANAATPPSAQSPDAFAAVADPTRRAILDGLRTRARSAGDIAADFTISRPAVSKHLRVLSQAGLVRVVKHGRERHYHLDAAPLAAVDDWLNRYRLLWAARLANLKEYLEQEAAPQPDATSPPPPPNAPT